MDASKVTALCVFIKFKSSFLDYVGLRVNEEHLSYVWDLFDMVTTMRWSY